MPTYKLVGVALLPFLEVEPAEPSCPSRFGYAAPLSSPSCGLDPSKLELARRQEVFVGGANGI
jgi:hypothetical protein